MFNLSALLFAVGRSATHTSLPIHGRYGSRMPVPCRDLNIWAGSTKPLKEKGLWKSPGMTGKLGVSNVRRGSLETAEAIQHAKMARLIHITHVVSSSHLWGDKTSFENSIILLKLGLKYSRIHYASLRKPRPLSYQTYDRVMRPGSQAWRKEQAWLMPWAVAPASP